jgi:hypothetical protein
MNIRDADNAFVDLAKLQLFCLDARHPRGACKARQFTARLGLTARDAEELRRDLIKAMKGSDRIVTGKRDEFGQRYQLDVELSGPKGRGTVRTFWITRDGDRGPRLVTCFVV